MRKSAAMGATDKVKDDSKPSSALSRLPTPILGENSLKVRPSTSHHNVGATTSLYDISRHPSDLFSVTKNRAFTSNNPSFFKPIVQDRKSKAMPIVAMEKKIKNFVGEAAVEEKKDENQIHFVESKKYKKPKVHSSPYSPRNPSTKKAGKTFRMYAPQQRRNSITIQVGSAEENFDAEKIFFASQIRTKSYSEWRQEAKALLPSNTGGAPIQQLVDVINAAPTLQKEGDPRALQRSIKRMSQGSNEHENPREKKKPSRDYTKMREIYWADESKKRSDSDTALDLGNSGEEDEKERMAEYERKQAGIDIKAKIVTLRQLADHLSNKRKLRQELLKKATGHTVLDSEELPIKEQVLYFLEIIGDILHDVFQFFIFWEKHIKEINGRFGVVNANYFIWLRRMVVLEIAIFFLALLIVIWPQMKDDKDSSKIFPHQQFRVSDLVTGEGYFRQSYMYYTGFEGKDDPNEDNANFIENPALRFILLMFVTFLLLTYFIFSALSKYYQSSRMESTLSGVAHMNTFKAIICGWDFSCRDPKGKIVLHKTIQREMLILAMESQSQQPEHAVIQIDRKHKKILAFAVKHLGFVWGAWAIHIVGNLLIIAASCFLGLSLFYVCKLKLFYYVQCVSDRDDGLFRKLHDPVLCPQGDQYLDLWILSAPALCASLATLLLTKFIIVVGDSETWSTPEMKIYATMIRAGLVYFTNIGVIYYFWMKAKPALSEAGFVAETIFGAEVYRLVVIQGLVEIILNLGWKGLVHCIRRNSPSYEMAEFRSESYCLDMFFVHSVSRIGAFFCPPLGIFVTLRLIVDFYQNKYILFNLSSHMGHSVHVSQVYAPFLLTFFVLCYVLTNFINVHYLFDTLPSPFGGPFQHYTKSYGEVLSELLAVGQSTNWIARIGHPAFLSTSLIVLGALCYLCREWALTYEPIIVHLNALIAMERGDRDLLLKAIFEIGLVTTDDFEKAEHSRLARMRRVAIFHKRGESTSMNDDYDEYSDDDKADEHIDELIHHVQHRKTIAALEIGHLSIGNTHRTSLHPIQAHYKSSKSDRGSHRRTVDNYHKQHVEEMQSILARIVAARRNKSQEAGQIRSQERDYSRQHSLATSPHHPTQEHHHDSLANQQTSDAEAKVAISDLLKNLAINRSFKIANPILRSDDRRENEKK